MAGPEGHAAGVTVLAEGRTTAGEHWSLTSEPSPMGRHLGVRVTAADGHPYWGTGCILDGGPQQEPVNLTAGSDDAEFLGFVYDTASKAKVFAQSWDQALSATAAETLLDNIAKLFQLSITPDQWIANMNKAIGS